MAQKEEILDFLKTAREKIISKFEALENGATFTRKSWQHSGGGGGEIGLLRGNVFEKAAVNFSAVYGESFPLKEASGPYFATGISIITHMKNPHAPTAHLNIRYIETEEKSWLGGGFDLTPMGKGFPEDKTHFHSVAQTFLNRFDPALYPVFAKAAESYFFIPHRNKERGVGGIFFDHQELNPQNYSFWQGVPDAFLEAVLPIYTKRVVMPFTEEDKDEQLKLRGHYVEFNLLYDKGTRFGFVSGGNPEAILCSMPPLVSW